jgi:hypothetical protein
MQPIPKKITTTLATLGLLVLTGCSTLNFMGPGASNTSRAQFLDEVWVAPSVRGRAASDLFTSVYVAPVSVERLKAQDWWRSQGAKTQSEIQVDAIRLGLYLNDALENAVRAQPGTRLRLVNLPGPGTLIVETAITELVPAKAFWNTAASAAGFVVPGAGLLGMAGKGAITIEGRLRDGGTGAVLATFRDRETDQAALLNLASYTWYHGSQRNIDEFAGKTAEVLNAPADRVVKSSLPIKLTAF